MLEVFSSSDGVVDGFGFFDLRSFNDLRSSFFSLFFSVSNFALDSSDVTLTSTVFSDVSGVSRSSGTGLSVLDSVVRRDTLGFLSVSGEFSLIEFV